MGGVTEVDLEEEDRAVLSASMNWQLMLTAAVAGVALGICALAALYGAPLVRLRLAADEEGRARVLEVELERLRRLGDAAAVLGEHGRSQEAEEARSEIEFQTLLLAWAVTREDRLSAPRRAREGQR